MAAEPPYRFAARGTSVGLLRWMAARSIWSMPPEHARRVLAGGASRHSGRVLAQRRAVAQHLRDRELHGGTGGCGEAGSRRIATGSARQVAEAPHVCVNLLSITSHDLAIEHHCLGRQLAQ